MSSKLDAATATATPRATGAGYRMPAEWEPQEAIWLSWPCHPESWPGRERVVEDQWAHIAAQITRHEKLRVNAAPDRHGLARRTLERAGADLSQVELFPHPNDDAWCRDHGPIFVKHRETGALAVTDWQFNGWGDKFGPHGLDDQIPARIAAALGLPRLDGGMVLEGGAIEINSRGQLLTTEAVLLNENRNPHLDRAEIERRLCETLGASEIFWLGEGLEGDDTDGHIDDIARFVTDDTVVLAWEPEGGNWNHRVLCENRERLGSLRTPAGGPVEVIELPLPRLEKVSGWRLPVLPGSYANFLILNTAVLVPVFGDAERDREACGILADLFPGREVLPVPSLDIVHEGGAVHCLSQQQPAFP